MKRKKIKTFMYLLVVFQVILLVNAIIAQPYFIHQAEKSSVENSSINKKEKDSFKKIIVLLTGIISIKQIGTVSAITLFENQSKYTPPTYTAVERSSSSDILGCCREMTSGALCEDLPKEASSICKTPLLPTECRLIDECKIGCCVDPIGGVCSSQSPKGKCVSMGGEWSDKSDCQIPECTKGCCVLGENVYFINEKQCESLSLSQGFQKDFKDLRLEMECLVLAATQEMGACVSSGGACSFKTEKECLQELGTFHKNYLCSNPSLETECTRQESIGCFEGKDEIYWFDSCGNRENIYSSDRDASWNNGMVLTKEQSCNSDSSNVDSSSCGNCNRMLSSVCSESTKQKVADGDFVCKDLRCKDQNGNIKYNGESWCIYDSYIGDGKDPSGSEHWRAYCNQGTIEVDMCGDYRGSICVQSDMEKDGKTFSIGNCVPNTAYQCIMYNQDEKKMVEKCQEDKHCLVKQVTISPTFSFDFCTPKYPKGFNTDTYETNNEICSLANTKCTVVSKKRGGCIQNCECETKIFSDKMNDLCISLGDCGTHVNYVGTGTNNVKISGAPQISWTEYKKYANPVKGKYAEPQSLKQTLSQAFGILPVDMPDGEAAAKLANMIGTVSGASGLLFAGLGGSWGYLISSSGGIKSGATLVAGSELTAAQAVAKTAATEGGIAVTSGSVGSALAGAALGAMIGSYLASSQGITGTPAVIMTIAGAIAGGIAGYAIFMKITTNLWGIGGAGGWTLVIMVAIIIIISIMGWGKTKTRIVEFTCLPWEAPLGGEDCHKCNEDSLKPCTEYRCKSLGQACILLNPEQEFPTCQSLVKENIPPVISPLEVDKGYEFNSKTQNSVRIVGESKECIQEFTPVKFLLETDEHAQCKYSFVNPPAKNYNDMEANYPFEGTAFTINHTFGIVMPSIGSLSEYDIEGDLRGLFANMSIYVRCQDYWGNFNSNEYIINFCVNSGPDVTPVNHLYTTTTPLNGAILKHGTSEVNVTFFINEPAECKYSLSSGKDYGEMEKTMECYMDIESPNGWWCNTLMNTSKEENKIYVKCKDQPWFIGTENETDRNINREDYVYIIKVSKTPLNIISTSPSGRLISGMEPYSVDLELETSGGAQNGRSICYWGENLNIPFWETDSNKHKQTLTNIMSGNYGAFVMCKDSANNIAKAQINFTLELDTTPPLAVRTYKEGSNLRVITDEKAECYYTLNTCDFEITNGTSMTTALSTTHRTNWETGKTYHIKCRDIWGNTNPWCAMRIQPT